MVLSQKLKRWTRKRCLEFCKKCKLPFSFYSICNAKEIYHQRTGKELSYYHPVSFNDKMFWLARYWQDPLIVNCSDKLAVRTYVESCGLSFLLNELYAVYNDASEIDWNSLPDSFVAKCNHGCGFNILCKDKSLLNKEESICLLNGWMQARYGMESAEYQYLYIKPIILIERYIDGGPEGKLEIQFFCFNGKAKHILLRNDLGDASSEAFAVSYDMNWQREYARIDENASVDIVRPDNLDELISYAEILASPFPQVRVDFYLVGEQVFFGELTFSSCGNILSNYRDDKLAIWYDELVLPKKSPKKWASLQ